MSTQNTNEPEIESLTVAKTYHIVGGNDLKIELGSKPIPGIQAAVYEEQAQSPLLVARNLNLVLAFSSDTPAMFQAGKTYRLSGYFLNEYGTRINLFDHDFNLVHTVLPCGLDDMVLSYQLSFRG